MISVVRREYSRVSLLAWTSLFFLAGCSIHGVELRLRATAAITPEAGQTFSEAQIQQVVKITEEVAKQFRMYALEPSLLAEIRRRESSYWPYTLLAFYEKPGSGGYTKRGEGARVQMRVEISKNNSELHIAVADRNSFELTPFVREIQETIRGKVKDTFLGYTMEWKEG